MCLSVGKIMSNHPLLAPQKIPELMRLLSSHFSNISKLVIWNEKVWLWRVSLGKTKQRIFYLSEGQSCLHRVCCNRKGFRSSARQLSRAFLSLLISFGLSVEPLQQTETSPLH